ncbi:lysylphosphatidylglycerol synthase transmembrane domain-containing protein [Calothrix rhizosoleniae]|uniref:lysylphosphatidylglycerol synthase transmembrane domain-containing protein n=1 Tax=Calothrix rhizosoleniae TaxID=888997 RepID=UPI000B49E25C|nr:lysylphosphatidylglycerol synthase transmembrane domain-containing protein [Calothrix rhizosoleniae]
MKKVISIIISPILLAVIYSKIDFFQLVQVLEDSHKWWIIISLSMVIPLAMLTAWRLQQLMPTASLGFGEANRLILSASVLNMILPSKMGDIAKAYFIQDKQYLNGSLSLSLVIFEKICDLLSILLWCAFGLILYPQKGCFFLTILTSVIFGILIGFFVLCSDKFAKLFFHIISFFAFYKFKKTLKRMHSSWQEMHNYFWHNKIIFLRTIAISIFISFGHFLQIWLFILALNAWTPFLNHIALCPLAILAGLIPLTFAGIGTRDAAFIALYQPYLHAPTAAALGLLCTSRYLLLAIGGIPFLGQYLSAMGKKRGFLSKNRHW